MGLEEMQKAPDGEVWTTEQVAAYLNVSEETVRKAARQRKLPGAYQVLSMWRFRAEEIRNLGRAA